MAQKKTKLKFFSISCEEMDIAAETIEEAYEIFSKHQILHDQAYEYTESDIIDKIECSILSNNFSDLEFIGKDLKPISLDQFDDPRLAKLIKDMKDKEKALAKLTAREKELLGL